MSTVEADVTSARETVANLSSDELFKGAMTDETPSPQPAEPSPPAEPTDGPSRDERGRFASKDQAPSAPAAATQQPPDPAQATPPAPDDGGPVPSWRHRELREQRDAADHRARQLEAALIDYDRRMRAMQDQVRQQQAPAPQVPDMIADPDAYHQHVQQTVEERMRNMEANFSFRLAHNAHGELFEQAYTDMIRRAERGDPSVVRAVMQSPDPGIAMVNWYRREQTLTKVGDDPDKWFEQQLRERLKDQKFAGQIVEQIRGGIAPQANGNNSAPNVQLPPSLHGVASAAPNLAAPGDMSDASLFHHAFRAR